MKQKILRLLFSPLMLKASTTKKIAYLGVMTALCVVINSLEFKFSDVQFSLTIFISVLMGILLGSIGGFSVCFVGDVIGYLINSMGYVYMIWVGLATALTAFIAGLIFYGVKLTFKGNVFFKLALITILSFIICTVGINSTGFYFYNLKMGFSEAVINYVNERFNTGVGYFGYLAYRLFFKGQIYNSIANYALSFVFVPLLLKVKFFAVNDVKKTPPNQNDQIDKN